MKCCEKIFGTVKIYLCTTPVLVIFNSAGKIALYTDASIKGVGAVLKQPQKDVRKMSFKTGISFLKKIERVTVK